MNVLNGLNGEQLKRINAPIDSAVLRVMLNTSIVKVNYVSPSTEHLSRGDMTEICQEAMRRMAGKLSIMPMELDSYIWTIGSNVCKHRGRYCSICPITGICESYNHGFVRESSGNEYMTRCFSFARPQTEKNALYIRGCDNCPNSKNCVVIDSSSGIKFPMFGGGYEVKK